ncbi:GDP-mannose 4,6-dehydratase [bacterium]|nr:GDP-mannose 4,6-dehydratase [bacterium]
MFGDFAQYRQVVFVVVKLAHPNNAKPFTIAEVDLLIGDPTKAKEKLGWVPQYDLFELVKDMMNSDLNLFKLE